MNWYKIANKTKCKGWTAVRFDANLSKKIQQWGKDNIPSDELNDGGEYGKGRETDSHITVLYGLGTKNREAVKSVLSAEKPVTATLGKVGCFVNNDDFDVVIVKVDSPDLAKLHQKIEDELHVELTHNEYKPHATIAYVKKGNARKHAGDDIFAGEKVTFNKVVFKDGVSNKETIINLNG